MDMSRSTTRGRVVYLADGGRVGRMVGMGSSWTSRMAPPPSSRLGIVLQDQRWAGALTC